MSTFTPLSTPPVFTSLDDPNTAASPTVEQSPTFGRFALGRVLATPGALSKLSEFGISPLALLMRHATGDWGELDDHDRQVNELAVAHGDRILSCYLLRREQDGQVIETRLWAITEADRSHTVILKPSEY